MAPGRDHPLLLRGLIAAVALALLFAAMTGWALESGGVARIETQAPGASARTTHVWYVESEGELWLEAGTPENGWFLDVQGNPEVRFEAAGKAGRYLARPVAGEEAHARIRSLLRTKYGLRDVWVGLLVDTSRSVAVRLVPRESSALRVRARSML